MRCHLNRLIKTCAYHYINCTVYEGFNDAWQSVPKVVLSATADPELLDQATGWGLITRNPDVPWFGQVHLRVIDCHTFSKSGVASESLQRKLAMVLRSEFARHGEALFVSQKAPLEAMQKKKLIPEGVKVMYHGGLASNDSAKGIAYSMIVGQALPTVTALECMTEALFI